MMKIIRYAPNFTRTAPQFQEWTLAVDVIETAEAYQVKASVPGINPDDIEVTFQEDVLTIRAERKMDEDIKTEDYHIRERNTGVFTRSLRFNAPVNSDAIAANIQYGVLTLSVPKAEEALPRKIAVQVR